MSNQGRRYDPADSPWPYVPILEEGETPGSWLDRVAVFYGLSRRELWKDHRLGLDAAAIEALQNVDIDIDLHSWPRRLLQRLPVQVVRELHRAASSMSAWSVDCAKRSAYCPHCFEDDIRLGRQVFFRQPWAAAWLTHCPDHRTPLMSWRAVRAGGQRVVGKGSNDGELQAASFVERRMAKILASDLRRADAFAGACRWNPDANANAWREQVDFESQVGRAIDEGASLDAAASSSRSSSRLVHVRVLADLVLAGCWPTAKPSSHCLMAPAGTFEWVWNTSSSSMSTFPVGGVPRMEALPPEVRRTVLWMTRLLLSDDLACTRPWRPDQSLYVCGRCMWASLVRHLSIEQRVAFGCAARRWPKGLRRAFEQASRVMKPVAVFGGGAAGKK